jgi:hypothetical protein
MNVDKYLQNIINKILQYQYFANMQKHFLPMFWVTTSLEWREGAEKALDGKSNSK